MSQVIVVTGPGSIGQAIARRVSAGKHVVLADLHQSNADRAADVMQNAGFDVSTATVDVSSCDSVLALIETATTHGDVTGSSTLPAFHPVKRHPKRSLQSTCMELRSCSRSSATSSLGAAQG
jgi:NAD(P)-dependent dehydrogenase (short-subunit alcohol dehydrogenase family)